MKLNLKGKRGYYRSIQSRFICKSGICLLFFLLFSFWGRAQSKWEKDILFLKEELPKNHMNLFFQMSKESFESELDALLVKADNMSDIDILLSIQQIIAKARDSHTRTSYIEILDKERKLPLDLYWFDDGIYVISTTDKHERILGTRLDKIENHSISQVIDSLKTLIVQDNNALNKLYVPILLIKPHILSFFGFTPSAENNISFSFRDTDNNSIEEIFFPEEETKEYISINVNEQPLFMQDRNTIFWDKYLDNGTYYIQYNSCSGKEVAEQWGNKELAERLPSFNEFTQHVLSVVDEKPIEKFIFDMRFNGGGSSMQGTKFVRQIKENDKINKKGTLYVIIGRHTFSSAIINTMNFEDETNAIIVGEETGGMPNHYGEVKSFRLPHSKIPILYSTKYFQYIEEDLNTITPDIKVEYKFEDYLNGIDPSMNAILEIN